MHIVLVDLFKTGDMYTLKCILLRLSPINIYKDIFVCTYIYLHLNRHIIYTCSNIHIQAYIYKFIIIFGLFISYYHWHIFIHLPFWLVCMENRFFFFFNSSFYYTPGRLLSFVGPLAFVRHTSLVTKHHHRINTQNWILPHTCD
jgi:hypothetical protein